MWPWPGFPQMKQRTSCQVGIGSYQHVASHQHWAQPWLELWLCRAPLWAPAYVPRGPALITRKNRNTRQTGQKKVKVQRGTVRQKNTLMSIFLTAYKLLINHKPSATWLFTVVSTALIGNICRGDPNTVVSSRVIQLPKLAVQYHLRYINFKPPARVANRSQNFIESPCLLGMVARWHGFIEWQSHLRVNKCIFSSNIFI